MVSDAASEQHVRGLDCRLALFVFVGLGLNYLECISLRGFGSSV